jgi:hypothetical protein
MEERKTPKAAMPYLITAAICEKCLLETDNAVSIIRVIDTITIPEDRVPAPGERWTFPLNIAIVFKNGKATGKKRLILRAVGPTGKKVRLGSWPFQFGNVPEGGNNIRFPNVVIPWTGVGLYWIDVILDKTLFTRMPLRIKFTQNPD